MNFPSDTTAGPEYMQSVSPTPWSGHVTTPSTSHLTSPVVPPRSVRTTDSPKSTMTAGAQHSGVRHQCFRCRRGGFERTIVRAVGYSDLPVDATRIGCGAALAVAVEVIDAKPAIATEAASAAGVVDAGVALAVPAVAEAAVAVGSEACAIVEDGVRVGVGRDAGAEVEGSRAEAVLAALAAGALVAETREQCQEVVDVRRAVAIDVARGVRAEGREQQEQVWEQEQVCEWHAGAGAGAAAGAGL